MVERFAHLPLHEQALWIMIVSIAALLALALAFVVTAIALRIAHNRKARRLAALECAWEPLILDHLIGGNAAPEVWAAVAPRDHFFFVHVLQRYLLKVMGTERRRLVKLAEPCLPLLSKRAGRGQPEDRALAIRLLGLFGFEEYNYQLMEALEDESPLVAMIAARSLARPDHTGIAMAVLANLHRLAECSPQYVASMVQGFLVLDNR
jgi:hypothetical protein